MKQKDPNSEYPITFGFRKIEVEQFAIIQEAYKQNEEVTLTINTNFSVQPEHTQVGSHVTIKFNCINGPFLIIQVACFVGVDQKSWKQWESEDKTITIPAFFATHLVVLTVGTLRGILHSKTEGTIFNRYIVPSVNVVDLIKEDVKFKPQIRSTDDIQS